MDRRWCIAGSAKAGRRRSTCPWQGNPRRSCAELFYCREVRNDRNARRTAAVNHGGCSGDDVGVCKNPKALDPAGEQHIRCGGNFAVIRAVCFKQFNSQFHDCLPAEFDGRLDVWLRWILDAADSLDVVRGVVRGTKQDLCRLQRAER